ncbi:hypothetical protein KR51_00031220 [Rubidibacter lacunae KORDI 51-2]|uniref:Uncharacterized protein n=1 Tax=Rubidibacter lacunae KORDI 51-2 TaxID=582515 RepID=U5DGF6_9CHRO|nr:hypothetical protein KR51_00031220 [Rubidibacter lacunae KORDI 51-2]
MSHRHPVSEAMRSRPASCSRVLTFSRSSSKAPQVSHFSQLFNHSQHRSIGFTWGL